MRYADWVPAVLSAASQCENNRTRLLGVPVPALRESLHIADDNVDAIEDAVYDLEVLGLAHRRPNGLFNLTEAGRQAATSSIEAVCGAATRETCTALTDQQRSFLQALIARSAAEGPEFARLHYVNVSLVFEEIGLMYSHLEQESFLLPLVEEGCIDYREYRTDRDARALFTAVACVEGA